MHMHACHCIKCDMHHDACYSNMQVTCMLCAIAVGYVTIATGVGIHMLDCAVCSLA